MAAPIEEALRIPALSSAPGADGWIEEVTRYAARPRDKSTFRTVLDAKRFFGNGSGSTIVTTRVRAVPVEGEPVVELNVKLDLGGVHLEDQLVCLAKNGRAIAGTLTRVVGDARRKEIDFPKTPWTLPLSTYPEVLLPFLMRGQPFDGAQRAVYAWTSDRFVARVYYESRAKKEITLPSGKLAATELWMYPDLNDWVPLGTVLTKMTKPFLPRYEMWFETAAPHRLARFEGSYGPPGAPEVVLELA